GGRERLGDRVRQEREGRQLRPERDRIHVRGSTEGEQPVHLVVEHVEGALPLRRARAPRVLLEHQVGNGTQGVRIERGAGGIERRVERQEPCAAQQRRERIGRGQKPRG